MIKRVCSTLVALAPALALALLPHVAEAKTLSVGDSAPSIAVKKFVKGTPVTSFQKGKLYVVEFWATWCGPCKVSIPHLTELQKKYKDVTFIGVSVFEQSQTGVEPFVKSMGDKMDYRVALDSIPEGKNGQGGVMATTWMEAAEQPGIPTAFVVDKEGKLAWIGHPMAMEEPLKKIVAGKWDLKAAAAEAIDEHASQEALQKLGAAINPLMQKKDYAGALALLDAAIAKTPKIETTIASVRVNLLISAGKEADACTYMSKLVDTSYKDNAQGLNELAWGIVNPANPQKASAPLLEVALKAAIRGDSVSGSKDPSIADTLAVAYFANGKKDLAISTEQRAIKLCTDANMAADLKKNLATFQK